MEQPLHELIEEINAAEERWAALLKELDPEAGPKPRFLKKKPTRAVEPTIEIFPLPNVDKSRGGILQRTKKQLRVLEHQLTYENNEYKRELLINRINQQKEQLKNIKKNKKQKKNKNL